LATVLAALEGLPVALLGRTTVEKRAKFTYCGETVFVEGKKNAHTHTHTHTPATTIAARRSIHLSCICILKLMTIGVRQGSNRGNGMRCSLFCLHSPPFFSLKKALVHVYYIRCWTPRWRRCGTRGKPPRSSSRSGSGPRPASRRSSAASRPATGRPTRCGKHTKRAHSFLSLSLSLRALFCGFVFLPTPCIQTNSPLSNLVSDVAGALCGRIRGLCRGPPAPRGRDLPAPRAPRRRRHSSAAAPEAQGQRVLRSLPGKRF